MSTPQPVETTTGRVQTPDGFNLFYRAHLPAEPQGVLLFVHGLAEHSGRYGNPIEYFAPRGQACYALDLRGHGESPGKRVHVDHFDDYDRDVTTVRKLARAAHPNLPLRLVGHSMGGLIVLRHLLHHPGAVDGAILSSPGLAAHPSLEPAAPLKLAAKLLSRLLPGFLIDSGIDSSGISRDPEVVAAYRADPLVSNKVSARWYTSVVDAQHEVRTSAAQLTTPILLMQSGADTLVSPEATARWGKRLPQD